MNKDQILKLKLVNTFVMSITNGLLGGLWNRFYNENLPYTYLQLQMFIVFIMNIFVGWLCENIKYRKIFFKYHVQLYVLSLITDIISIIVFQMTHNCVLLLIGDTITILTFVIDDVAYVEMDSALLDGNERSVFSHKSEKVRSFGALISYSLSLLVGILLIKNKSIPYSILTVSQYISWITNLIILIPSIMIYNKSKRFVVIMWRK